MLTYISLVLVSSCIDNCQQTRGQHGMYCTACCFYATYGERHSSKTYRVHQLTALLPLNGQLSSTYTHIKTTVVQNSLTGQNYSQECRRKYKNALHANTKIKNDGANNVPGTALSAAYDHSMNADNLQFTRGHIMQHHVSAVSQQHHKPSTIQFKGH